MKASNNPYLIDKIARSYRIYSKTLAKPFTLIHPHACSTICKPFICFLGYPLPSAMSELIIPWIISTFSLLTSNSSVRIQLLVAKESIKFL